MHSNLLFCTKKVSEKRHVNNTILNSWTLQKGHTDILQWFKR